MANKTVTVKSSGGDYTSLNAALAGELAANANLVTMAGILTIECYDLGTDDVAADTGTGWTTNASYYINVVVPSAQRHDGKWNTSKYRILMTGDSGSAGGFTNRATYTRLTGLQIKRATSGTFQNLYGIYNLANELFVDKCIVWFSVNHAAGIGRGLDTSYSTHTVYNSVFFANGSSGALTADYFGIVPNGTAWKWYNVTVYGFNTAYRVTGGAPADMRNCIAQNSNVGYVDSGSTLTGATHNLSDKADALGTVVYNSKTVTFVDAANGDFHLAAGDTEAKNNGTDLSGTFTDDIDGVTRSGTWDLGADEYVAAGGGTTTRNRVSIVL